MNLKKSTFTCAHAIKHFMYLIGLFSLLMACKQDEFFKENQLDKLNTELESRGTPTVLGNTLENPYKWDNMNKALQSLSIKGKTDSGIELPITHHYVRFLPKDTSEYYFLAYELNLPLYDYPLDVEIEQYGDFYHDPSLQNEQYSWQYTVVEEGFKFPSIEYELLYDLFMPVDEESANYRRFNFLSDIWEDLEEESFIKVGLLDRNEQDEQIMYRRYNPQGRIQVRARVRQINDDGILIGITEPLEDLAGAEVSARTFTNIARVKTMPNGTFYINSRFLYAVNYRLIFKTYNYGVTDAFGITNRHDGPKTKNAWNLILNINANPKAWVSANMVNAFTHYETQARKHHYNLRLPEQHGRFIKVRALWENGQSNVLNVISSYYFGPDHPNNVLNWAVRNDVRLYTQDSNGNWLTTDGLYSVIMHELGHISHYLRSPINFGINHGMVRESWAECIEYYFTGEIYPGTVRHLADKSRDDIIGRNSRSYMYSPFFIDLIDNTNQRALNSGRLDFANDNVNGYSIRQIDNALNWRTSMRGVCTHLRNTYSNPSRIHMEDLLEFYEEIKDNPNL